MATIDIGKIKPVFKGTYDNSTAYVLDDIVYYNGSSYVAKTSTTGNLPTDTTKWNILASGSGGIWDSTLSLGSAGQSVKVNSGGTALEFGTISSDFVKLNQVTTGTAQTHSVDGYFSSDYKSYKVLVDVHTSGHSCNMGLRFNVGGSTGTASNYIYSGNRTYRNSSGGSNNNDSGWNTTYAKISNGSGNVNHRSTGEINIYNVGSGYPQFTSNFASWNNTTEFYGYAVRGLYSATTDPSGFSLFVDSGTIIIRSLTLYGLK